MRQVPLVEVVRHTASDRPDCAGLQEIAPTRSTTPNEKVLHQQLIEQFYQSSLERYGSESEQSHLWSRLLRQWTEKKGITWPPNLDGPSHLV